MGNMLSRNYEIGQLKPNIRGKRGSGGCWGQSGKGITSTVDIF